MNRLMAGVLLLWMISGACYAEANDVLQDKAMQIHGMLHKEELNLEVTEDKRSALLRLAIVAQEGRNVDETMRISGEMLAGETDAGVLAEIYFNRGYVCAVNGRYVEAYNELNSALAAVPSHAAARRLRSRVLFQLYLLPDSPYRNTETYLLHLEDYNIALQSGMDDPMAYYGRGFVCGMLAQTDESYRAKAHADMEKFLQLTEKDPGSYRNMRAYCYEHLARSAEKEGRLRDAAALYEKAALAYDNKDSVILNHYCCIEMLQKLGDKKGVIRQLDAIIETADKPALLRGMYEWRGTEYYGLGRYGKALQDFQSEKKISPDRPDAYNNCAMALMAMKRYEEALAEADKAIELSGGRAGMRSAGLDTRADILLHMGKAAEALACHLQIDENEITGVELYTRARIYEALGEDARAAEALKHSLRLGSEKDEEAVKLLGKIAARQQ